MIISSGWGKGLSLKAPKGVTTRPTSARVRAAILNTLMPWLEDALVLDLFAGSGAMGLEAVSRGAKGAIFVERDRDALRALNANLEEMSRRAKNQHLVIDPLRVISDDVAAALGETQSILAWGLYDIILCDPPYADVPMWVETLVPKVSALLKPDGVLVFESGDGAGPQSLLDNAKTHGLVVLKQKAYGDTVVTVLSQKLAEDRTGDSE